MICKKRSANLKSRKSRKSRKQRRSLPRRETDGSPSDRQAPLHGSSRSIRPPICTSNPPASFVPEPTESSYRLRDLHPPAQPHVGALRRFGAQANGHLIVAQIWEEDQNKEGGVEHLATKVESKDPLESFATVEAAGAVEAAARAGQTRDPHTSLWPAVYALVRALAFSSNF